MASANGSARGAGSRSGVVDNSAKSAKVTRSDRPIAAASAAPAYSQVNTTVASGSVAVSLSARAANVGAAQEDLASVLGRLGLYEPTPATREDFACTENVLEVLTSQVNVGLRSLQRMLESSINGPDCGEKDGEEDQEEATGNIAQTSYGRSFYYAADTASAQLRDVRNKLERLRTSLLGERPTADLKTAAHDGTGSLYAAVSVLCDNMDNTVNQINELIAEIRNTLLGE
ncbi:hypothetical protein pEaSNUABM35_00067 [Erwinia phage pEa_SNUABM_35]|uniref:Uncharacterized protein n=1 Tax=Erwinia phage pEa_SNUABM_35 TaxID=2869557 RepID=A0AAE7XP20_9CAUD|nr:hypothetical protein MPK65_gp067 [Erwinia phage pEa_SNUABM_35]QZE59984.1 hypothetical protein pEaSNUABM35_00067 [Erwinia phage pEa_SNUABM_35]QZE60320.1 hypothetical protein pEaSNUABM36_00067 [Erwinia phage pEa_SNUABM_36]